MKTREEILKLWSDTELCPDFAPVLEELLNDREQLQLKVGEERREAFHAGYSSQKEIQSKICKHEPRTVKVSHPPFTKTVCLYCGENL